MSLPPDRAPRLADLPEVLPLFPLTGFLLLPGNWMPLNVFEPRYRHMVEDLLAEEEDGGGAYLGMIQPVVPRSDNHVDPLTVDPDDPTLYTVGCAGRIEKCEPQDDGRFHVLLRGVCRFRVAEELSPRHGYRRVRPDYSDFHADLGETAALLDPDPLLAALRDFALRQRLEIDFSRLELLPGPALVNGLSVALPFSPGEKQALLEADDLGQRHELLLSLMGMGLTPGAGDESTAAPVVH
ncbi:MAG TPA: LON peptidase substrate-binding domain-containing protein [Thermoanaerobaculia bacterium]|nr:LON peptidase substrate-binding domain-containing protein [Thermoanaerobaculia bacterium]